MCRALIGPGLGLDSRSSGLAETVQILGLLREQMCCLRYLYRKNASPDINDKLQVSLTHDSHATVPRPDMYEEPEPSTPSSDPEP